MSDSKLNDAVADQIAEAMKGNKDVGNTRKAFLIGALKSRLAEGLKSNTLTQKSVTKIVYDTLNSYAPPENPNEEAKLKASSDKLGEKIFKSRLTNGTEEAVKTINESFDKAAPSMP